jgi:hypothetical protein
MAIAYGDPSEIRGREVYVVLDCAYFYYYRAK